MVCPESKHFRDSGLVWCKLNDKPCIRATFGECEYYDEWLQEVERQEAKDEVATLLNRIA